MMIKKSVHVSELKPGMITVKEIISEDKVLVGKGVTITESILNKLKEHYIFDKIEICYEGEDSQKPNSLEKQKSVQQIEEEFVELSSTIENIFDNIYNVQATGMEEVRGFAKKIQEELTSTSSIIKNIVLYGSGKDSIYRHSVNVAALSSILGKWLGFTENDINLMVYSAILHDFGKTKIDENVLNKDTPLTNKELIEIKNHPVIGYNFIKQIPFLDKSVSYGVLMHHERMDGSGYPLGIKQDQIHQFAQIVAICDIFDAINSDRVYKKSKGPFEALEIIQKESIGRLNYEYCNVFLRHIVNYYMGESVLLNNYKVCKIIQIDINNISKPLLLDDSEFLDLKKEKDLYIEKLIL